MNEPMMMSSKQRTSRPSKRWRLLIMLLTTCAFIMLTVFSSTWEKSLKVEKLVIEGARSLSSNAIVAAANISMNTPLSEIDLSAIQAQLMRQPYIESAVVSRGFPDRICVDIIEREPVALVNAGNLYYLDVHQVLLPVGLTQREFDVPMISGIGAAQNVQPGKPLANKEITEAIRLYQTAESIDTSIAHMISEINMNGGGDIILYVAETGVPIRVGRGDYDKKLVMLESFWSSFIPRHETSNIQYIDLRYEDQVIVKRNGVQQVSSSKM